MKLMVIPRGLRPFARVRQNVAQLESMPLRNQVPCTAPPMKRSPRRRVGLSAAGVKLFSILAYRSEPGRPRGPLLAWPGWEHVAHRLWPTMAVPKAPYGLLRMRIRQHRGRSLTLPDGTTIGRNSTVGELHCDNQALLRMVLKHRINPYRACREDLHCMAAWARTDELGKQVEAFVGRTMLAVGAARMGFTVREVRKSAWLSLERFFMIGLLLLYTESGIERLKRGTTVLSYPREVWISRRELIRRYGQREGRLVGNASIDQGAPSLAAATMDLSTVSGRESASSPSPL